MNKLRILVVEDERIVARDLAEQLHALGYDPVAETARGDEGVELTARLRPDLVLMDIHLDGPIDGIGAACAIRDRFSIPVIFLTAFANEYEVERAKSAGPFGYILKPFDHRELRLVIEVGLNQHRTECRLRRSDERMQAMLRASMDSFWVIDLTGRVQEINEASCQLTGYSREELLQMNLSELEPDSTPVEIATRIEEVMQSGSRQLECRIRRKDGEIRTVEVSMTCPAGPERLLYCFSRDVTLRLKDYARLQQLTRAVEQCPASIVITDKSGRIEYVNPHFEQLTGYSAVEAIGLNPRVLRSGAQSSDFYRDLWTTLGRGQTWSGEFHNRRKDGSLFWEKAFISPMRSSDGRVTHYVAVKEDISDQKQAAMDRSRRESVLTAVIENQNGLIWLKNREGFFLTVNRAFARACSVTDPMRIVGKTDFDFWTNEVAVTHRMTEDRVMEERHSITLEEEFITVQGEGRWFEVYIAPVVDASGAVIGTTGNAVDITERRRAREELIQVMEDAKAASRAKSSFLAAMSHELRTPLNVINGISATLLEQALVPAHRQALEMTLQSGHSLLAIIEEILDFSSLQAGKSRLDPAPFDLAALLQQVISQIAELPGAKQISITASFDAALPAQICGDARRLRQVLLNLLSNAVKFTARGAVHLVVRPQFGRNQRPGLHCSVVDTGIGIDAANRDAIFQPFVQANDSIKRRFGGTGLGLTISRSFIQLMGGELHLRSRMGVGSAFYFNMPYESVPLAPTVFAGTGLRELVGEKILIAVSVGKRRRMLSALARSWGMEVTVINPTQSSVCDLGTAAACKIALIEAGAIVAGSPLRGWLDHRRHSRALPVLWLGRPDGPMPEAPDAPNNSCNLPLAPADLARKFATMLGLAPLLDSTPVAVVPSSRAVPIGQRIPLTILAADDIQTNRQVVKMILAHLGYQCKLVENGAEVVAAVQAQRFDLILLDVQMPVMDGLAAAREICRLYPNSGLRPKIVALTANALQGDREICLAAGMDGYLTKPIVPATLVACIQKLFSADAQVAPVLASAVPVEATVEAEWIDGAHLKMITQGLSEEVISSALAEMQASAGADFERVIPQVRAACADQNSAALHAAIHGLKGCFQMLGWARAAERCKQALVEVRANEFSRWTTFPDELQQLYQTSHGKMIHHLAERTSVETSAPCS